MDVTSTTSVTKTRSNDIASNPNSKLDKDAFMKLFLTQLQYQDPTAPMKTKDMMQQTAQLSQMETNNNLQSTLKQLSNQLSSSSQYNTISAIGKMADTGHDSLAISDAKSISNVPFDLYFKKDFSSATIDIKDSNGHIVKSMKVKGNEAGLSSFKWDAKDDSGNPVPNGAYTITASYTPKDSSKNLTTKYGTYPVSSIKFEDGQARLKIGDKYYSLNDIKEIY